MTADVTLVHESCQVKLLQCSLRSEKGADEYAPLVKLKGEACSQPSIRMPQLNPLYISAAQEWNHEVEMFVYEA